MPGLTATVHLENSSARSPAFTTCNWKAAGADRSKAVDLALVIN